MSDSDDFYSAGSSFESGDNERFRDLLSCNTVRFCMESHRTLAAQHDWRTWKPPTLGLVKEPNQCRLADVGDRDRFQRTPVCSITGAVDLIGGPCDRQEDCTIYLTGYPFVNDDIVPIFIGTQIFHRTCCSPSAWSEARQRRVRDGWVSWP